MKQAFGKLYKGQIRDGMTGAPKVTEVNAKVAERFENMTKKEQKAVEDLVKKDKERYQKERIEFNEKGYYTMEDGTRSDQVPEKKTKSAKKVKKDEKPNM